MKRAKDQNIGFFDLHFADGRDGVGLQAGSIENATFISLNVKARSA